MNPKFLKKVRRQDRIAGGVIRFGGVAVILSVLAILFLIAKEALPLFKSPDAEKLSSFTLPSHISSKVLESGVDDYHEKGFYLTDDGLFHFYDLMGGEKKEVLSPNSGEGKVKKIEKFGNLTYALFWEKGSVSLNKVHFTPVFDEKGKRTITFRVENIRSLPPLGEEKLIDGSIRIAEEEGITRVALFQGNRIMVEKERVSTDLFGDEERESFRSIVKEEKTGPITTLLLDQEGKRLYGGTEDGFLLKWDLSDPETPLLADRVEAFPGDKITALALVFGDISLAVGTQSGKLSSWFSVNVPEEGGGKRLRKIHELTSHESSVSRIYATVRDKSLLSIGEDGVIHLDHTTSERHLLTLPGGPYRTVTLSNRGNGFLTLNEKGEGTNWELDNPHPEISFKTLFGKVWYEGYEGEDYVWQSSAGSDDFEPKLSLIPLLFGSIKGTFYAMILALPLAICGAVYTSQFASKRWQGLIKPTVEIMAAMPSVVIGFLAALWLAPLVERGLFIVALLHITLPLTFLLFVLLFPIFYKKGDDRGLEFLILVPTLLFGLALTVLSGPAIEAALFQQGFNEWLRQDLGVPYDQRNCVIIAFALGFTVIPIIFTIAEDSLSNVPGSLSAASLALGASRWQTVWRVIVPSASPGIFGGAIIGFGRAVGETMIVLMATGNTPIMDWSIFNGMRTLSANIAVEIPEAPVDGSLYRVLFLSAVLLFLLTFFLNTGAEVIRQVLRKKYGRHE